MCEAAIKIAKVLAVVIIVKILADMVMNGTDANLLATVVAVFMAALNVLQNGNK